MKAMANQPCSASKTSRSLIETSIECLVVQERLKIKAFGELMRAKLDAGDTQARNKSRIEVDDRAVWIMGEKVALAKVIAGRAAQSGGVRGFVSKWRTRHDSNV